MLTNQELTYVTGTLVRYSYRLIVPSSKMAGNLFRSIEFRHNLKATPHSPSPSFYIALNHALKGNDKILGQSEAALIIPEIGSFQLHPYSAKMGKWGVAI